MAAKGPEVDAGLNERITHAVRDLGELKPSSRNALKPVGLKKAREVILVFLRGFAIAEKTKGRCPIHGDACLGLGKPPPEKARKRSRRRAA